MVFGGAFPHPQLHKMAKNKWSLMRAARYSLPFHQHLSDGSASYCTRALQPAWVNGSHPVSISLKVGIGIILYMTFNSPRAGVASQSVRGIPPQTRALAFNRIDDPTFVMSFDIEPAQKNTQYTPFRKLSAFCRGLIIFEPMVEVARVGLKHDISPDQRSFYINRLIKKGRALDMHDLVTNTRARESFSGCKTTPAFAEETQLRVARKFNSSFPADLHQFISMISKFVPLAITGVALGMLTIGGNIAKVAHSVFEDSTPITPLFTVVIVIGALAVYEAISTRNMLTRKAQEMLESGNMTCKEARRLILDTVKRFGNPCEIATGLRCEMEERR